MVVFTLCFRQVLEVHEQLEKPSYEEEVGPEAEMDETEKALIRQMCNVSKS